MHSKDTKKIITSKKKGENLSLGLPLTDEIRKQAFTDKGKLHKGWYYEENGLLTNDKVFYISNKYAGEYKQLSIVWKNEPIRKREILNNFKKKKCTNKTSLFIKVKEKHDFLDK